MRLTLPEWMRIMASLADADSMIVVDICSSVGLTYSHTFAVVKELESVGMLKTVKKGRTRVVRLTPKGKDMADMTRLVVQGAQWT